MNRFEVVNTEDVMCFTPKQVMEILGDSETTIYELFRSKDFPSFRSHGRNWKVRRIDFFEWQEKQKQKKRESFK